MEAIDELVSLIGGLDVKPNGTYQRCEVTDPWSLRVGDHVIVGTINCMYHHAIFIGTQSGYSRPCFACMIKEYGNRGGIARKLRIVEYHVFMRGYDTYFIVAYNNMPDDATEALARAKTAELAVKLSTCPISRVIIKYDKLIKNNDCFALFCKTGAVNSCVPPKWCL
jgi:hypothetical protein